MSANESGRQPWSWPPSFPFLAIAGALAAVLAYLPMEFALDGDGLAVHLIGMLLFVVWLAGLVATPVGVIGTVVRAIQRRRRG